MAHSFIISVLILFASIAYANEGGEKKADAHGGEKKADAHGGEKKADAHGGEKKADAHGGGHGEEAPPPAPTGPKREYNAGKIMKFPSFKAQVAGSTKNIEFQPKNGHAVMIIFLASWCEPCQILMGDLKQLARKYSGNNTDVYFVFAHDTKGDAAGFIKEHQLANTSVMADIEMLTAFKNPELPSVYVSDKWGYLADRFLNIKKNDIDKIDTVMGKITTL